MESPSPGGTEQVPACYHDLCKVSVKERLVDYPFIDHMTVIDFLLCLSKTEQSAMKEYVQEALHEGYICPSISLASTGGFFVEKKEGGL